MKQENVFLYLFALSTGALIGIVMVLGIIADKLH